MAISSQRTILGIAVQTSRIAAKLALMRLFPGRAARRDCIETQNSDPTRSATRLNGKGVQ